MLFFFFKQKTAYEMRISDWSSDVCSSDLRGDAIEQPPTQLDQVIEQRRARIFQLVTVGQRLVVQRLVAHGFGARGVVAHWAPLSAGGGASSSAGCPSGFSPITAPSSPPTLAPPALSSPARPSPAPP